MRTIAFVGAALLPAAAHAAQFAASADLQGGVATAYGQIAAGPASGAFGSSGDGGRDAFDTYGYLTNNAPGGLVVTRQSEFFAARNLYRFYDTFTNTSGAAIATTVRFSGDLGSDGGTSVRLSSSGLLVTCQFGSACSGDPVVAAISSNNGSSTTSLTQGTHSGNDRYNADFMLTVLPGQSVSLLNFAFLASDAFATNGGDETLAIATARSLQSAPFLDGLTEAQRARIVNFDLNGAPSVPEPATWAMMVGGFGLLGAAARRRARAVCVAA